MTRRILDWLIRWRWVLLPVALGAIFWAPSLRGGFIWDDWVFFNRWIAGNNSLKAIFFPNPTLLDNIPYYKPLAGGSSYLLFVVFGQRPFWWRMATLLLHLGTIVAMYFLLLRVLRAGESRQRNAMLGALAFAVWPTASEVMGWISARGEPLIALFLTFALVLHLRARDRGTRPFGAALLFFAALLSKETAVAFLPAVIAMSWLLPPADDATERGWRASLKSRLWLPYLLVYLVYAAMRQRVFGPGHSITAMAGSMIRRDAFEPAIYAWGFYVREALLLGSAPPYLEFIPRSATNLAFAAGGALVVLLAGLAALREKTRVWAAPVAWFLLFLGPPLAAAGSSNSITPIAIRYLYAPCLSVGIVAGLLAERLGPALEMSLGTLRGRVRLAAVVAALVSLFVVDNERVLPWMSEEALWTAALQIQPHSVLAHGNLASAANMRGDDKTALDEYRIAAWTAIPIDDVQKNTALGNLARYYLSRGNLDMARLTLLQTLKHHASPSTLAVTLTATTVLDLSHERELHGDRLPVSKLRTALSQLEQAEDADPFDPTPRRILGIVYETIGEPVRAKHAYQDFMRVNTETADQQAVAKRIEACDQAIASETDPLKKLYFEAERHDYDGDLPGAITAYSKAQELFPDRVDVIEALADAVGRNGDLPRAETLLEHATELAPQDAAIWLNLGVCRGAQHKYPEAAEAFLKSAEVAPAWAKPYLNAARALDLSGDRDGAVKNYHAFLDHYDGPQDIRDNVQGRLDQLEPRG